jgi:predicted nucleotidyltransferase
MDEQTTRLIGQAAAVLKEAGAQEVYLFGSAARGAVQEDSDIDLAVSGLPPRRFFAAMARAAAVLQRPLDLVDLDQPTPFTRYLQEEGELCRVG